jgi:hypothetical protein
MARVQWEARRVAMGQVLVRLESFGMSRECWSDIEKLGSGDMTVFFL